MTKITEKIQTALDEGRILILGVQILVGLQYRSVFEPGYDRLPGSSQYLTLDGLGLILIAFGLFMSPVSYHRIVEHGTDHKDLHRFVLEVMKLALLPFALSLGITLYVAAQKVSGAASGVVIGALTAMTAVALWYGLGVFHDRRVAIARKEKRRASGLPRGILSGRELGFGEVEPMESEPAEEQLKEKIRHVLTEARMVLPGAQALMGFQFVIMLMTDFDKLPKFLQEIHLSSLILTTLTTILLMTPATYHRLVERGENTERFHHLASKIVLMAMVPLAAGVSADFYVVAYKVTESPGFSLTSAVLLLLFFYGLWFGFTAYRRRKFVSRAV